MRKSKIVSGIVLCGALAAVLAGCTLNGIEYNRFESYKNADAYEVGGGTYKDTDVTSLDIVWVSGDIVIETSEAATDITVSEQSSLSGEELILRRTLQNGTLKIKYAASRALLSTGNMSKALTVTFPSNYELSELEIDTAAGSITMSGLSVKGEISVDVASADVDISDVSAREISVDTASGRVDIKNATLTELDVDTASGDVSLEGGTVDKISVDGASADLYIKGTTFRSLDFDSASGDAEISLADGTGFTCEFDTVSGKMTDGFGAKIDGKEYVFGDGSVKIKVDTVSGRLSILKA